MSHNACGGFYEVGPLGGGPPSNASRHASGLENALLLEIWMAHSDFSSGVPLTKGETKDDLQALSLSEFVVLELNSLARCIDRGLLKAASSDRGYIKEGNQTCESGSNYSH